ncbi:M18 family aminopeptidase [Natronoglycomyces albus]|uniref:M18 family aminopeptidase n=1 Tax=Natronoglycomyces albus TaxID=2811108 RepID=A0A895XGX0_9ACTN|nr:M18 family aminopeptidase [Natronoglycomyces albus]QSB04594.1 M18 family aminopeptidase [Natronoglycomyces albus]
MPRFDRSLAEDLAAYIHASPTPSHACEQAAVRLRAAGFQQLAETQQWPTEPGGYFLIRGGSLVGWYVRESGQFQHGFRVFGGHTDSPTLRVKPLPDVGKAGWQQIGVEIYGGVPHDTWLDRDLGVAGRLALRSGETVLVHVDRPLLRVPRLAIHLDRRVNVDGNKLNAQTQMTPIWGLGEPTQGEFVAFLADEAGVDAADVLGFDVVTCGTERPAFLGRDSEFLAAPRLDNLMSTHAGVAALIAAAQEESDVVPVLIANDHEEIGSVSYSGAQSPLLDTVLRRLIGTDGACDPATAAQVLARSAMMSSDTGHAVHPNYAERHEPDTHPLPNGGPMLKINGEQNYATSAEGQALFTRACEAAEVPSQFYVQRNDLPCGSTIGAITSARLGVQTVDVGPAILSMHSAREMCGTDDTHYLAQMALAFMTGA